MKVRNEYVCRQKVPRWGDCLDKPATCEGRRKRGPGKGVRWLGGQWDGRVNVSNKLTSRAAEAGRGRDKEGSGGDSRHIFGERIGEEIPDILDRK